MNILYSTKHLEASRFINSSQNLISIIKNIVIPR